jgi:hypothetical protein
MTKQKRKVSPQKIVAETTAHTGADPREEFFDPVLPVIDAHRKRVEVVLEAVRVEGAFHGNMESAAHARLEKAMSKVWASLHPPARALVTTQPTTLLGAVALLQYLMMQFDENGDCTWIPDTIDDEPWPFLAFRTLASALLQVRPETAE